MICEHGVTLGEVPGCRACAMYHAVAVAGLDDLPSSVRYRHRRTPTLIISPELSLAAERHARAVRRRHAHERAPEAS